MNDLQALATELLPPRLQEFVRLVGLPATMLMVEKYGGMRIYVPAEATPDHPYAELIGMDNLARLCAEYAADGLGLRFTLPKATRALIALRDETIRADYAHKSARTLAAEHRLGERQVERIVAGRLAARENQPRLF